MSQKAPCKNNSSYKSILIKYCYHTITNVQEDTRNLLMTCDNDNIIEELYTIFNDYILPYFYLNRTVFNRIRNKFVSFMYIYLSNIEYDCININSFMLSYRDWCFYAGAYMSHETAGKYYELSGMIDSKIGRMLSS